MIFSAPTFLYDSNHSAPAVRDFVLANDGLLSLASYSISDLEAAGFTEKHSAWHLGPLHVSLRDGAASGLLYGIRKNYPDSEDGTVLALRDTLSERFGPPAQGELLHSKISKLTLGRAEWSTPRGLLSVEAKLNPAEQLEINVRLAVGKVPDIGEPVSEATVLRSAQALLDDLVPDSLAVPVTIESLKLGGQAVNVWMRSKFDETGMKWNGAVFTEGALSEGFAKELLAVASELTQG